uniref:Uncharacterized protein n=1 Tax=Zea mays TaxID=4577 RepID=A0A804QXM7_MAIZE
MKLSSLVQTQSIIVQANTSSIACHSWQRVLTCQLWSCVSLGRRGVPGDERAAGLARRVCRVGRGLDGEGRLHGDAAEAAVAGAALHPDVATLAPGGAPGVLDDPVGRAVVADAVADRRHAVVQVRTAVAREHALRVELERLAPRVDGHGHRLVRHRLGQRVLAAGRHHLVAVDHHDDASPAPGPIAVAGAVGRAVRVRGLGGDAAEGLDELEGVLHQPALAPVLVRVAVDQLLLRQRRQAARPDGVDALHGHHRREGPAASAVALVLHARHRALLPPVHGPRRVGGGVVHEPRHGPGPRRGGILPPEVVDAGVGERGPELLPPHVAEPVQAEAVGPVAALVVRVDEAHVLLERPEPPALLAVVPVHPVVRLPPLVQVPQRLVRRQVPLVEVDRAAQLHRRRRHEHQGHKEKRLRDLRHPASALCLATDEEGGARSLALGCCSV